MEKKPGYDEVEKWLVENGLDPETFAPEIWAEIHSNLECLKNVSGLNQEEIAARLFGRNDGEKMSGSKRVAVSRNLRSKDVKELVKLAEACGFNPFLIFFPGLRIAVVRCVNALNAAEPRLEDTVFKIMVACNGCGYRNQDPVAKFCSRCGKPLSKT